MEITPVSIKSIEWRTYIYFAVFNALFIPLIYFFYPETKNLTLEQIDKLFTGNKVLLHWHPSMDDDDSAAAGLKTYEKGDGAEVNHIDEYEGPPSLNSKH